MEELQQAMVFEKWTEGLEAAAAVVAGVGAVAAEEVAAVAEQRQRSQQPTAGRTELLRQGLLPCVRAKLQAMATESGSLQELGC